MEPRIRGCCDGLISFLSIEIHHGSEGFDVSRAWRSQSILFMRVSKHDHEVPRTIIHLGIDETIRRTVASTGRRTKDVDADLVRRGYC